MIVVRRLILANIAIFIIVHLFPSAPWLSVLGLSPRYVWAKLWLWQPLTYMFIHAGLWHLAVNMLMLWFFGPAIETSWGKRQFLFYYFFTGIGAGLCNILASWHSTAPVIGASGAIFGILVAYALMFPETEILMFFIIPMKMKQAILFLAGLNLLGALSSPHAGIAYFAHLGGGLFGYLYLKHEWLQRFSPADFWRNRQVRKRTLTQQAHQRQTDAILDKISRQGMESLSKKEKNLLKRIKS
ncbi:MAG: rhomboid family intramembrane serine protease [Candidatus Omnitrophota bacterium]